MSCQAAPDIVRSYPPLDVSFSKNCSINENCDNNDSSTSSYHTCYSYQISDSKEDGQKSPSDPTELCSESDTELWDEVSLTSLDSSLTEENSSATPLPERANILTRGSFTEISLTDSFNETSAWSIKNTEYHSTPVKTVRPATSSTPQISSKFRTSTVLNDPFQISNQEKCVKSLHGSPLTQDKLSRNEGMAFVSNHETQTAATCTYLGHLHATKRMLPFLQYVVTKYNLLLEQEDPSNMAINIGTDNPDLKADEIISAKALSLQKLCPDNSQAKTFPLHKAERKSNSMFMQIAEHSLTGNLSRNNSLSSSMEKVTGNFTPARKSHSKTSFEEIASQGTTKKKAVTNEVTQVGKNADDVHRKTVTWSKFKKHKTAHNMNEDSSRLCLKTGNLHKNIPHVSSNIYEMETLNDTNLCTDVNNSSHHRKNASVLFRCCNCLAIDEDEKTSERMPKHACPSGQKVIQSKKNHKVQD